MKIEDLRIAVETDRAMIDAYRAHDGQGHVEVFNVTDPAGEYVTTVLFDADSEEWTIEPDEIWAYSCESLMEALLAFCGRIEVAS